MGNVTEFNPKVQSMADLLNFSLFYSVYVAHTTVLNQQSYVASAYK